MVDVTEREGWATRRSVTLDFTSNINQTDYRLGVALPFSPPPTTGYPVLFVLDGAASFGTASETARSQSMFGPAIEAALVLAISYQSAELPELLRLRYRDLTTPAPPEEMGPSDLYLGAVNGGMDAFLRVVFEEIGPIVASRFPVDPNRRALFGHSLGGLTTLRAMLKRPQGFASYIASSPSLHWNDRAIFGDLDGFRVASAAASQPSRLLMSTASDEQTVYPMTTNVRDMAQALRALDVDIPTEIVTHFFEGENHDSVVPAALSRAVRFAFAKSS